jgi:hypothetical protein
MAKIQVRHTRPIGGNWTLWQVVELSSGHPGGLMVTRQDEATGIPVPVAFTGNNGPDALAAMIRIQQAGRDEDYRRLAELAGHAGAGDYRDEDPHHSAEVFEGKALWPIDAAGRLVTYGPRNDAFGGRIVRARGTRRMMFEDFHGGRFPFPAAPNKNGTSELAIHTPKLGGKGREVVGVPTAA